MGNTLQRQDVSARGDEWKVVQTSQLEPAPEQSSTRQPQLEQYLAESGARDARRLRILHAVAHEVRNHLNAIRLVATCLTKGADLNGNREDLAVLASNVCDIDALIERLVDFANLLFGEEKLNPECLNLADLHRDVAFVLRKMAEDKGLRFSGTVEQGLVEVVSDCLKLREIAPEPRYQRREIYAVWQRRSALRPARLSAGCWKSMTRAQGFLCRARKRFSRTFNVFPKLVRASPVPDSFSQSCAVLLNCSRGGSSSKARSARAPLSG